MKAGEPSGASKAKAVPTATCEVVATLVPEGLAVGVGLALGLALADGDTDADVDGVGVAFAAVLLDDEPPNERAMTPTATAIKPAPTATPPVRSSTRRSTSAIFAGAICSTGRFGRFDVRTTAALMLEASDQTPPSPASTKGMNANINTMSGPKK